jgi:tRNA/rRNA methyltransferase
MSTSINLDHVTIVLQKPRYSENIGAAARAACNMGIGRLIVVAPENYQIEKVNRMATHAAAAVVAEISLFDDLPSALAPFNYVVGTTARLGDKRPVIKSPGALAEKLIPVSRENRIAVVFGPEDRGLSNRDTRLCHTLVNIPTADFSSLNLAQAVMVICYELHTAGSGPAVAATPRMASRRELDDMYAHLQDILVRISYINAQNPGYWLNRFRKLFNRLQLRGGEVSIIRGLCRQIDWYGKKCYEDGRSGKKKEQ